MKRAEKLFHAFRTASGELRADASYGSIPEWAELPEDHKRVWRQTAEQVDSLDDSIDELPESKEQYVAKIHLETARLWYAKAPKFEGNK